MPYFEIVVAAAATSSFALTILACCTEIRSIRTVLCHRAVGCCVIIVLS